MRNGTEENKILSCLHGCIFKLLIPWHISSSIRKKENIRIQEVTINRENKFVFDYLKLILTISSSFLCRSMFTYEGSIKIIAVQNFNNCPIHLYTKLLYEEWPLS